MIGPKGEGAPDDCTRAAGGLNHRPAARMGQTAVAACGSGRTTTVSAIGTISSTGEVGEFSMLGDSLEARRLVDADGADRSVAFVEHIAADPADFVGHVLVSDLRRASACLLKLGCGAPSVAPQDCVEIHDVASSDSMMLSGRLGEAGFCYMPAGAGSADKTKSRCGLVIYEGGRCAASPRSRCNGTTTSRTLDLILALLVGPSGKGLSHTIHHQ